MHIAFAVSTTFCAGMLNSYCCVVDIFVPVHFDHTNLDATLALILTFSPYLYVPPPVTFVIPSPFLSVNVYEFLV